MSKRKKNYPDPMEIVNKYGADALRWVWRKQLKLAAIQLQTKKWMYFWLQQSKPWFTFVTGYFQNTREIKLGSVLLIVLFY